MIIVIIDDAKVQAMGIFCGCMTFPHTASNQTVTVNFPSHAHHCYGVPPNSDHAHCSCFCYRSIDISDGARYPPLSCALVAPPSWPHSAPSPRLSALKHWCLFQQPIVPVTSVLVADCCVFCVLCYDFLPSLDCLRKDPVVVVLPCCCCPLPPSSSPSLLASIACQS
jgi:hypothetical protein